MPIRPSLVYDPIYSRIYRCQSILKYDGNEFHLVKTICLLGFAQIFLKFIKVHHRLAVKLSLSSSEFQFPSFKYEKNNKKFTFEMPFFCLATLCFVICLYYISYITNPEEADQMAFIWFSIIWDNIRWLEVLFEFQPGKAIPATQF